MIRAIELQNFKCVRKKQRIEVRPLTLLFGPNSAGKSTVLDSVATLCEAILRGRGAHTVFGIGKLDDTLLDRSRHSHSDEDAATYVRVVVDPDAVIHEWANSVCPDNPLCSILSMCQASSGSIGLGVHWGCDLWTFSPVVLEVQIDGRTALMSALPSVVDRIASYPIVVDAHHPALRPHVPKEWVRRDVVDCLSLADAATAAFSPQAHLVNVLVDSGRQRAMLISGAPVGDSPVFGGFGDEKYWCDWQEQVSGVLSGRLYEERRFTNSGMWTQLTRELPLWIARLCGSRERSAYVGAHRRGGETVIRQALDGSLEVDDDKSEDPPCAWIKTLIARPSEPEFGSGNLQLPSCLSSEGHRVSRWCSDPKRLDLGVELEIVTAFEVMASEEVRRCVRDVRPGSVSDLLSTLSELGTPSFRLRVRTPDGGLRQLSEVGEGIGCVIPVVVSALMVPGVVYIEQPEIHLHPRIEARLGDLFTYGLAFSSARKSAVNGLSSAWRPQPCRIIETHSEHLVLRLLRRLREGAAGQMSPEVAEWCDEIGAMASLEDVDPSFARPRPVWLRPEDLAVVCAEVTPHGTVYRPMKVTKDGELVGRWPGGFFEERWEELG